MQSFLNSPQGPLGGAGQTGTSTTPQNLFNNAAGFGSRFGAGINNFKDHMGAFGEQARQLPQSLQGLFGAGGPLSHLFGGDGGILGGALGTGAKGMFGPNGIMGIPGRIGQIPQNMGNMFSNQSQGNRPDMVPPGVAGKPMGISPTGVSGQGGMANGGFLSRFMRPTNNG